MLIASLFLSWSLFLTPPLTPVEGRVIQRFVAPMCQRCSGHRGVTVLTTSGSAVVATVDGVITFAGTVAGRVYVVQTIAKGTRMTYGWLQYIDDLIEIGALVMAGQRVGTTTDNTYLGVRIGTTYVDPMPYLGVYAAHLVGFSPVVRAKVGRFSPSR